MDEVPEQLVALLESGVFMVAATRGADLRPEATTAVAMRIHADRRHLTIHLPASTSRLAEAHLRDNGELAITCSRVADHRTVQLKGRVVALAVAGEEARPHVERYLAELTGALRYVGLPPRLTRRMNVWPCLAVDVEVHAIFDQTPGPGAGAPLSR